MKEFPLGAAVSAVQGTYRGESHLLQRPVCGVAIDNRKVQEGFLFVPIKGERFDGHEFIPAAYEAGAFCCITEQKLATEKPYILVEDSLAAFQALAEFYKSMFDVKTVGITGSVGKTTTKELIGSVLTQKFDVLKSEGNLNNQTGVPLTVFRLEEHHEVAVVEMGTNHFGEIRSLSKIVRPDLCVLTNIGEAHIEHLGSKEGILNAKSEMLEYMRPGGRVFVNGDDPYLKTLRNTRSDVTAFGLREENDIIAQDVSSRGLDGTDFIVCFDGTEVPIHVPSPGEHMVYNTLAAFAVGHALGMRPEEIKKGIAEYKTITGRMCIEKKNGITVLDDVYNANPGSVRAALDVLCYAQGRKVCILGDMLELGEKTQQYHREVGAYAAQKADLVLCVGAFAENICAGARENGARTEWFETQEELIAALHGLIREGDSVLVKASRGMRLEGTVKALLK